jgi:hypothetical protein
MTAAVDGDVLAMRSSLLVHAPTPIAVLAIGSSCSPFSVTGKCRGVIDFYTTVVDVVNIPKMCATTGEQSWCARGHAR